MNTPQPPRASCLRARFALTLLAASILTAATTQADLLTGLQGCWSFDGSGADSSGHGRDLNLLGGLGFAPGLLGQSLDFHGDPNQYAERTVDDQVFDFGSGDFTIQAWVNYEDLVNETIIEKFFGQRGPGWTLFSNSDGQLHFFGLDFAVRYTAPIYISLQGWHQVVARRNGLDLTILFDNQVFSYVSYPEEFYNGTGSIADTTEGLLVGRRHWADGRPFAMDGRLDELALWIRALSDAEIATLWNDGNGRALGVPEAGSTSSFMFCSGLLFFALVCFIRPSVQHRPFRRVGSVADNFDNMTTPIATSAPQITFGPMGFKLRSGGERVAIAPDAAPDVLVATTCLRELLSRRRAKPARAIAVSWLVGMAAVANAAGFYEDFDADHTAYWVVNKSTGANANDAGSFADFFFDYSTVGIPPAPHSSVGTTRGLKLQANLSGNIFSGLSVSPAGLNVLGDFELRFDLWANYHGPLQTGGNSSTQVSAAGIMTSGGLSQWAGGNQDSVWFGVTGDGGSAFDYRAYSPATGGSGYSDASGVFAAGAETGVRNNTHLHYAPFGSVLAPAAQLAMFPGQTGSTAIGSAGMVWHDVVIAKKASLVTWSIDGLLISTVEISTVTLGGGNIFFGQFDINANSSSDPNANVLLFGLIDNVRLYPTDLVIRVQPASMERQLGEVAALSVVAESPEAGGPLGYQWHLNGIPLAGATAASLVINSVQLPDYGSYTVVVTNALASVTSEAAILERLGTPKIRINGAVVEARPLTFGDQADVEVRTSFPGGSIFYTTDGSPPSFSSTEYAGQFIVTSSVTLRAIAYAADFSQSVEAAPVTIQILPTFTLQRAQVGEGAINLSPNRTRYLQGEIVECVAAPGAGWRFLRWEGDLSGTARTNSLVMDGNKTITAVFEAIPQSALTAVTAGGGTIEGNTGSPYFEGTVVNLQAVPAVGWQFMHWKGDASGTEANLSLTMNAARSVEAVFGTTVGTTVTGPGTVSLSPANGPYPFGSKLLVVGQPSEGNYLARWGNAGSGAFNPLALLVTNPNPVVSALFASIPPGQVVLRVPVVGDGVVTASPAKNVFNPGEQVTLTAVPGAGKALAGWSGDAASEDMDLTVIMDANKTITATFVPGFTLHVNLANTKGPGIHGNVTRSPELAAYHPGRSVTLTAVAEAGWAFAGWSGAVTGSSNPLELFIDGQKELAALFQPLPGTIIWEFGTGGPVSSSPALSKNGSVHFGSFDGKLYALDSRTGAKQWEFSAGAVVSSSPTIGPDGTVYVGSAGGNLFALDGGTGTKLWEFTSRPAVSSSPAIGVDGTVYVGSLDKNVYGIDAVTGRERWRFTTGGEVISSPAIGSDGTVYVGSYDGKIYALDGVTGGKKWDFATGAFVESSPAIAANGVVYIGSADGTIYAIDGATGVGRWVFRAGSQVLAAPSISAEGVVFCGSHDGKFYALDETTGSKLWELSVESAVYSCAAVGAEGTVYLGAYNGRIYALDETTGAVAWEHALGGRVLSSPALGPDGTLYVGSDDGKLYALEGGGGGLAPSAWPMRGRNTLHTSRANQKPSTALLADHEVVEGSEVTGQASASDPDNATEVLRFSLVDPPAGAAIDGSTGRFTWTPSEAQGPGVYPITVQVTDSGVPPATNTATFTLTVTEENQPPVLQPVADAQVEERSQLLVNVMAVDPDLPANALVFQLTTAPAGASIDAQTGQITWTSTENQGGETYAFTVEVNDQGLPPFSDQQSFLVTVTKANQPPVFGFVPDLTIDEGRVLSLPVPAIDIDIPENQVTYSLLEGPSGAVIDPATGVITWTPGEEQGPGSFAFQVMATDDGSPPLSATISFSVVVREINRVPTLQPVPDQAIDELTPLAILCSAQDPDAPANSLSFSLATAPPGMTIDAQTGTIRWTPSEAQGPALHPVIVRVADNGDPALSAEQTFSVQVRETNAAPLLAEISPQTLDEMALMTVNPVASDEDRPANRLSFSLVSAPEGVIIDSQSGVMHWTPTEAQGPSEHSVTVRVTDDGEPALSAERTFSVRVRERNVAPVLADIGHQIVDELATLVLTPVATDEDRPVNQMTFSLVSAPEGMTVDAQGGTVRWTPTEAQGPSDVSVTLRVTDDGTPALSTERTFSIQVRDINTAPLLEVVEAQAVEELMPLVVTPVARDGDWPANLLTFSLVSGPEGMTIDPPSGVMRWTPSEVQGGAVSTVTVRVMDNGAPPMSAERSFDVVVQEVNTRPVLASIADQKLDELTPLTVTCTANDEDLPANLLRFSLTSAPAGMTIDAQTGLVHWLPTEEQGPSTTRVTVQVTDDGQPPLSAQQSFTVIVLETNSVPALAVIANQAVDEGNALVVTCSATDADLPVSPLTFSLSDAPAGMIIDAQTGVIQWTPTEAQGPMSHDVTVRVTDSGAPPLSAERSFSVVVREVNNAPVLTEVPGQTVDELTTLVLASTATDGDRPANQLTFSLTRAPDGMTIDPQTGVVNWTPTEAQGPLTHEVTVKVADDGEPALSMEWSFNVVVREVNTAPVLTAVPKQTLDELSPLALTCSVTDTDLPANLLTFSLTSAPDGMTIDPQTGVLQWTPAEAQGPSTNEVTGRVTDNGEPPMSVERSFTVIVLETNSVPVLALVPNQTVVEGSALVFTVPATDPDLPANALRFSLAVSPDGMTIGPQSGVMQWIPSEAQGGVDHPVTVRVVDDGVPERSAETSFTVTVQKTNSPPVVPVIADLPIDEGRELALVVSASDSDQPAQTLTFRLVDPPSGAAIDTVTGRFTWTPTEAQGPGTYPLLVEVADDGSPPMSTTRMFTVNVAEVNTAPMLAPVGDRVVNPGDLLDIQLVGSDADVPANTLTYDLVSGPSGATVDPGNGRFLWTPPEFNGDRAETVTVRVADNGVPVATTNQTFNVTVKAQAPVVLITNPVAGTTDDERIVLQGSASDNIGVAGVEWFRDGHSVGALSLTAGQFEVTGLKLLPGENRFRVVARDAAGNEGSAEAVVIWTPLRILAVADPAPTQEGQRAVFPINLVSAAEVGGASFMLRYDTNELTAPLWTWEAVLAESVNQVNLDTPGQIRATFSLPAIAVPGATQTLAEVSFRARSIPADQDAVVVPEILDLSRPSGEKLLSGTEARIGTVRVLRRQLPGDGNGNDRLDIGDATLIQRLLARLDEPRDWDFTLNDLNASGDLDSGDVTKVLRVVVGMDPQPEPLGVRPPPSPEGLAEGTEGVNGADVQGTRGSTWSRLVRPPPPPPSGELALLLPAQRAASPGDLVTVQLVLSNLLSSIVGATFQVEYPTNGLLLQDAGSLRTGAMVPPHAIRLWNVGPEHTNYSVQDGKLSLAVSSAGAWPSRDGVLAEMTFVVQPSLVSPVTVRVVGLELSSDGFEVRGLSATDAVISPNSAPTPATIYPDCGGWVSEGFKVVFGSISGRRYVIEASVDLREWSEVGSATAQGENSEFVDSSAMATPVRFYRVRSL